MRLEWIILLLLLAMTIVLGAAALRPAASERPGVQHPRFGSMMQADDDARPRQAALPLAWLYGVLQLALLVACLAFGVRGGGRLGRRKWAFLVGGLIYMALFSHLVAVSRLEQEPVLLVLGLPPATAVMLYLVWPFPVYFIVLYVVQFNRWVLPPESLARFEALVAAKPRGEGDD